MNDRDEVICEMLYQMCTVIILTSDRRLGGVENIYDIYYLL